MLAQVDTNKETLSNLKVVSGLGCLENGKADFIHTFFRYHHKFHNPLSPSMLNC